MNHDNEEAQEQHWPLPQSQDLICALAEGTQAVVAQTKRAGRPAKVSWTYLCLGLVLAIRHRLASSMRPLALDEAIEGFGPFSPVRVSDQAISNRLERAAPPMQQLFEQVSRWLQTRLDPYQDRRLAPFAHQVLALDESSAGSAWGAGCRCLAQAESGSRWPVGWTHQCTL